MRVAAAALVVGAVRWWLFCSQLSIPLIIMSGVVEERPNYYPVVPSTQGVGVLFGMVVA